MCFDNALSFINALRRISRNNLILPTDKELFMQFYPHNLYAVEKIILFKDLNDEDLLDVFIGLVQIEKDFSFKCGSTTPTWRVYQEISARGLDKHLIFANWAFLYTENDYTPFGLGNRHGANDAFEFMHMTKPNIDSGICTGSFSDVERRFVYSGRICPYCCTLTNLVDSSIIYNDESYGMIYMCPICSSYVGCYKHTHKALGRLANKELREAKKKAHHYLDQLWKPHSFKRPLIYSWLSEKLGIPKEFTHIGMSDILQCERIVELSISKLKDEKKNVVPYDDNVV